MNITIKFYPDNNFICEFIDKIKTFGKIYYDNIS